MERTIGTRIRINSARAVATHLEGEDARDVGREGECLQVEPHLRVLFDRVGHARRRAGQLALLAATRAHVARGDALDAARDFADILERAVDATPVLGTERAL